MFCIRARPNRIQCNSATHRRVAGCRPCVPRVESAEPSVAGRIEDYALLSDMESAALVGVDGSIDWLTFPRFDSPACFAALLGEPRHGRWLLAPEGRPRRVRRRYLGDSLVLETVFECDDGDIAVVALE